MKTLVWILALACGQEQAPEPTGWTSEVVLELSTKVSGCAVGDILPEHEGNEIAAVAGDGSVYVVWREDGAWKSRKVSASGQPSQCSFNGRREPSTK